MIGSTIAHYRVEEKLGENGMGEAFLAHDTKLNRDVTLKILSQVFALDSQRMARIESLINSTRTQYLTNNGRFAMKRLLILICLLGVAFPVTALSQNWTPEQKVILERVKTGWSTWQEAVRKKDLNIWLEAAQPTEDFQGWWVSDGSLFDLEAEKRSFNDFVKNLKDIYWERVQPLSIKVYGDVAIIYFYSVYNQQDQSGDWTRFEDKRLEIYRKIGGVWRWSDGMIAGRAIGNFVAED